MTSEPLTSAALCMGYGGLELAMEQVLGASPLWCAEFDDAPSAVIEHHWPGLPNYRDLTAIDWDHVPPVDVLTAGYPCQPFSHAGRRKGTADVRHLWPYIRDAIRVLRPRVVVLENVAGHLSLGADTVLADLASLLFDAEGVVVRASAVGACHLRARLFIVATDAGGERSWGHPGATPGAEEPIGRRAANEGDRAVAVREDPPDAQGQRRGPWRGRGAVQGIEVNGRAKVEPRGRGDALPPDAHGDGPQGERGSVLAGREPRRDADRRDDEGVATWGDFWPAIARHERFLGRRAPAPVDANGRLDPPFVEWMQMLPEGHVCDVPGLSRAKQLKLLGNGVVPPQAAYAVNHLLGRLAERERAA